uniref:L1 transposable element RRM domain-containing protein n=1 Tax=Paramormyrops kingsleyae TaxID=1676925 RepID=A0A3B3QLP2_9TELE
MSKQTKLVKLWEEDRSPIKNKFKETNMVSKEDLDNAVRAAAKLAVSEQRLELEELVKTSVREALEGILTPQINELKLKLEAAKQSIKRLESRCDNIQTSTRSDKATIRSLQVTIGELTAKIDDMEDRNRRSNLHLVSLKEGVEGGNAVSFLEANIPVHRIYSRTCKGNTPCTLIFKLLNYRDRQLILKATRAAGSLQHGQSRISFYPDYSLETMTKRKAFSDSFLRFPALLKVTYDHQELEFKSNGSCNPSNRRYTSPTIHAIPSYKMMVTQRTII